MTTVQTIGGEVAGKLEQNRSLLESAVQQGQGFSLEQWLHYLEQINPNHMALGLERVTEVAQRLHLYSDLVHLNPFIVTVAGTNGKGSTCALIADACRRLGCKVGLFTSPHLLRFNERINIDGQDIDDALLCSCLYEVICAQKPDAQIEPVCSNDELATMAMVADSDDDVADIEAEAEASESDSSADAQEAMFMAMQAASEVGEEIERQPRPLQNEVVDLTYFEITCLAAVRAMARMRCNLWVLEVGLGGRLDAVNAFPNDLAIITSIGMDHMKILGNTTAQIAAEKAGIIQAQGNVILGANIDASAMREILQQVKRNGASVSIEGQNFSTQLLPVSEVSPSENEEVFGIGEIAGESQELRYQDQDLRYNLYLPYPKVPVSCAGIALHAIFFILHYYLNHERGRYEDLTHIAEALKEAGLPGRMQRVADKPLIYLDVAHNVPAAKHLRGLVLRASRCSQTQGKRRAVVGMLKDKDVEGVLQVLKDTFNVFYVATLHCERGAEAERLKQALEQLPGAVEVFAFDSVTQALEQARADASDKDEITVLGSFVTVAEALKALEPQA